jgi:phage protein D
MNDNPPLLVSARPVITVDGRESTALGRDLIRLETHEDEQGLARLEAVFLNFGQTDSADAPGYVHFDRDQLDLGKIIEVSVLVTGSPETVFEGTISAIGASYPESRPPELTILAEDALAKLRLRRRSRAFENATDADIMRRILDDAGIGIDMDLAGSSHEQRWQVGQSELALLRERAAALDARITTRGGRVTLRSRPDGARPIPLTHQNELIQFEVRADLAQQRTKVRVHGWDVAAKQAIHEEAGPDAARATAEAQGRTGPEALQQACGEAPEDLHLEMPATTEEARGLAEARMKQRARVFINGRGTTRGTPGLRAGGRAELLDLGPWFSGVYEVTRVRHSFDQASGFRTEFDACRAALEAGA